MKNTVLSIAGMLMLALSLASCSGGGPKANAEKFLNGFWHMDYAAAKEVSTEATKKQLETFESITSTMMQANAREEAKKIKIEVKEPVVTGDKATVEYVLVGTGDNAPKKLNMVKQNGKWLAEWSKMQAGGMGGGEMPGMEQLPAGGDTVTAPPADGAGTAAPAPADTAMMQ